MYLNPALTQLSCLRVYAILGNFSTYQTITETTKMWKELIQTVENQKEKYRKKFRRAWIGKTDYLGISFYQ